MKQTSVGKLCLWNDMGLHDGTSLARCRMSLHLPASACICLYLPASVFTAHCPLPTAHCPLVAFCFICLQRIHIQHTECLVQKTAIWAAKSEVLVFTDL